MKLEAERPKTLNEMVRNDMMESLKTWLQIGLARKIELTKPSGFDHDDNDLVWVLIDTYNTIFQ